MTIKFGVIGTNWITESFIKAAGEIEDFQLNAVYSRTADKAKAFADKFNVEHTFTNLEEMAKSDKIDAVYIASPNAYHAQQAILFLKNKKHVLTEKAMASNTAEVKEMITAAKENEVLLMEALKSTFLPNFKVVQENLHKLGKIRRAFVSYCQYSSRYDAYKQGTILNAFKPELSNGALMDIGVYCLYPMVLLFGKPEKVKANSFLLESGVDGEGSIILAYPDMDVILIYSKITNSHIPSEIQGEDGNLIINQMNTPTKVEFIPRNGEGENLTLPQKEASMFYEAQEFIELIKAGKTESSINSFDISLAVMEVMDEVRRQTGIVFPADTKQ
ncbi:Gfo/Idh/MocA family oxidoreductase [Bacillus sp. PK3-056]|uniref:Gfo/Idh/MocA family protein n=1 Tax=Niallia circulans TaxID=1397 RepID=UPI0002D62F5A|nr:Gfo/Idh/MocA family oxidoreductase [Niallia circulans]AYV72519.1 oxidoreductase [Niallia circulans]